LRAWLKNVGFGKPNAVRQVHTFRDEMLAASIEHLLGQAVGELDNRWSGAIVLPQMFQLSAAVENFSRHPDENGHTRAPEAIDGLLWIADNQKLACGESRRVVGILSGILSKQPDDFGLHF